MKSPAVRRSSFASPPAPTTGERTGARPQSHGRPGAKRRRHTDRHDRPPRRRPGDRPVPRPAVGTRTGTRPHGPGTAPGPARSARRGRRTDPGRRAAHAPAAARLRHGGHGRLRRRSRPRSMAAAGRGARRCRVVGRDVGGGGGGRDLYRRGRAVRCAGRAAAGTLRTRRLDDLWPNSGRGAAHPPRGRGRPGGRGAGPGRYPDRPRPARPGRLLRLRHAALHRPRPRVRVLVTGDELTHTGRPAPGQVRDALGPLLPSLVHTLGGGVTDLHHVPDRPAYHWPTPCATRHTTRT